MQYNLCEFDSHAWEKCFESTSDNLVHKTWGSLKKVNGRFSGEREPISKEQNSWNGKEGDSRIASERAIKRDVESKGGNSDIGIQSTATVNSILG